jgi:hypothetical protein
MVKSKRPVSILARDGARSHSRLRVNLVKAKPAKQKGRAKQRPSKARQVGASKEQRRPSDHWYCASTVNRHAASAVKSLLAANATKKAAANIKELTMGPKISDREKKATFAVTCETLKRELAETCSDCGLSDPQDSNITHSLVFFLCRSFRTARYREGDSAA